MRYHRRKYRRFFGKTMVFFASLLLFVFGISLGYCYDSSLKVKLPLFSALRCMIFYGGDPDAMSEIASIYPLLSESDHKNDRTLSSWEVTYYHDEISDSDIPVFYGETVDGYGTIAAMGSALVRVASERDDVAPKPPEKMSVLIYCTHTAESYDGKADENGRGEVLSVAHHLADTLTKEYGIGAVVSDTVHDSPDWYRSYGNSKKTAQELLDQYPEAELIIDLHRDSGTTKEACTVTIGDRPAAKLLLVVGSDVNLEHPNWEQNWETAKALGAKIDEADPSLLKGIRVQKGRYNQHLSVNCVLLEVGTDLNTLDEAKHSAEWTAKAIYEYLQIQE